MNIYKFDFIIASNNKDCFNECKFYIEQLIIPENYEIGILEINDAKSMTSAYNEGMHFSDAKYKVYLHQDVFILNKSILYDILDVFESNKQIGMIGVLGCKSSPSNGMFCSTWDVGKVKVGGGFNISQRDMNPDVPYISVEAIDGMFMVTAYDLFWREEIFNDWHFYDVSQSFEFRKNGYQVVVPRQQEFWCLHDCGCCKLKGYDKGRLLFFEEYVKNFKKSEFEDIIIDSNWDTMAQNRENLIYLFNQGSLNEIQKIFNDWNITEIWDTQTQIMKKLLLINEYEKQDEDAGYIPLLDGEVEWTQVFNKYKQLKYLLRRIEHGYTDNKAVEDFLIAIQNKQVSKVALSIMLQTDIVNTQKTSEYLMDYL